MGYPFVLFRSGGESEKNIMNTIIEHLDILKNNQIYKGILRLKFDLRKIKIVLKLMGEKNAIMKIPIKSFQYLKDKISK